MAGDGNLNGSGQGAVSGAFDGMVLNPTKKKTPGAPATGVLNTQVMPFMPGPNAPATVNLPFLQGSYNYRPYSGSQNSGANTGAGVAGTVTRSPQALAAGATDGMTPSGAYVPQYSVSGGRNALDSLNDLPQGDDALFDDQAYASIEEWWNSLNTPVDTPTNGGGSGYVNLTAMLSGLGGALGPQAAPQYQTYGNPVLQSLAAMPQMQTITPEQLPEFQTWNPEMLGYTDFDPMRQNLSDVTAATMSQINQAWDPAIARLSEPLQTSVGSMNYQGEQVQPELSQLANVFGVSPEYDQSVMDANIGIQNADALFQGRGDLMDRAFGGARRLSADAANQGRAAGLTNANIQSLLAQAGLERMVAQDRSRVDQQNNTTTNQAGQWNASGLNDWGMAQATINNNANTSNTNNANQWALANWNGQNDVNAGNAALQNQYGMANVGIANQQADANAAAARPDISSLLSLITGAASNGQTLPPELIQQLLGAV